jgi:hypothetical protein
MVNHSGRPKTQVSNILFIIHHPKYPPSVSDLWVMKLCSVLVTNPCMTQHFFNLTDSPLQSSKTLTNSSSVYMSDSVWVNRVRSSQNNVWFHPRNPWILCSIPGLPPTSIPSLPPTGSGATGCLQTEWIEMVTGRVPGSLQYSTPYYFPYPRLLSEKSCLIPKSENPLHFQEVDYY